MQIIVNLKTNEILYQDPLTKKTLLKKIKLL